MWLPFILLRRQPLAAGDFVGYRVGRFVEVVGRFVCGSVGDPVGRAVGARVGRSDGAPVGGFVGAFVGALVGAVVGEFVGGAGFSSRAMSSTAKLPWLVATPMDLMIRSGDGAGRGHQHVRNDRPYTPSSSGQLDVLVVSFINSCSSGGCGRWVLKLGKGNVHIHRSGTTNRRAPCPVLHAVVLGQMLHEG